MKIDVYTKVILTGIFLCLCLILLRDVRFEKTAEAQVPGAAQPVVITGCTNGVGGPLGAVPVSIIGCTNGIDGRTMPLPVCESCAPYAP